MRIQMNNVKEKPISACFKEFYVFCKSKKLSVRTLNYYEECYYKFTSYYDEDNRSCSLNKSVIEGYINHLSTNTNFCNTSINTMLRGLRTFVMYCIEEEYLDPFKINLIKAEKKIQEAYTDEELKKLLVKPNIKTCSFSDYRNWVVINHLLATGNRLETIINIRIKHLDFESSNILLEKTKNKKQQIIPMSKQLEKIYMEYLKNRKGEGEEYLFCNIYGSKMTHTALRNAIRRHNLSRGVNKTSIHLFRHIFAKKWILAGGDIFRLQKILGHSSIDMVKEYVNIYSRDLYKDFDKFNPLEQIIERKEYIKGRG